MQLEVAKGFAKIIIASKHFLIVPPQTYTIGWARSWHVGRFKQTEQHKNNIITLFSSYMAYLWLPLLIKRKYYNIKNITHISFKVRINGNFHLLFIYALNFSNRNKDKRWNSRKGSYFHSWETCVPFDALETLEWENSYTVSLFQSEKSQN